MSDKIKLPEIIRMSMRNTVDGFIDKKVYYNIDTNDVVIPIEFINDESLFDEMADDLKIKYEDNRPTMYVKNRQGLVYPIVIDDDSNIINFTKNPPAEGGRSRRKSHRKKSNRKKSHRRKSHRRKSHRRRRH
jgi:hypothetical protein